METLFRFLPSWDQDKLMQRLHVCMATSVQSWGSRVSILNAFNNDGLLVAQKLRKVGKKEFKWHGNSETPKCLAKVYLRKVADDYNYRGRDRLHDSQPTHGKQVASSVTPNGVARSERCKEQLGLRGKLRRRSSSVRQ